MGYVTRKVKEAAKVAYTPVPPLTQEERLAWETAGANSVKEFLNGALRAGKGKITPKPADYKLSAVDFYAILKLTWENEAWRKGLRRTDEAFKFFLKGFFGNERVPSTVRYEVTYAWQFLAKFVGRPAMKLYYTGKKKLPEILSREAAEKFLEEARKYAEEYKKPLLYAGAIALLIAVGYITYKALEKK